MERRNFLKHAGLAGILAAGAAPAARAEAVVKWRLTSSFPKNLDTIYGAAEVLSKRLAAMTEGRFQVQVFAADELVPPFQALDAVKDGTVECCHTASYYYVGKDLTFAFGTAVPFGLNCRQMNAWLLFGGGQKLLDDFYANYNVASFPGGNTGTQMGGWFRKEINGVADMKGLKMRIPGLGGQVWAKLGAVPQAIPGNGIYAALEKGTIDAAEWVGPYDDEKLGFHKVAKNYYYPGWWEPGPVLHFFVNRQQWAKLPKAYQAAWEAAAREANLVMTAEYDHKNPAALARLLAAGVKLHKFSPEIMKAAYQAASALYADESAKNPAFKKVYGEMEKYRRSQNAWFGLAEAAMDDFTQANVR